MDVKYLSTLKDFSPEKLKKNGVFQTARFFLDVYCLKVGQSQADHVHAESDKVSPPPEASTVWRTSVRAMLGCWC